MGCNQGVRQSQVHPASAPPASLFSDVCAMKQFLWPDDLVSVAKFIHACLDKMFSCATGFKLATSCPMTARHLISLMWLEEM